jgi:hypothetical protein
MNWAWPQITLTCLMAFQVLCGAFLDGHPKKGNYSFAIVFCGVGINAFLLYMGGFWS